MYAPFGEGCAQSGSLDLSFTGMNQDTHANVYDFAAREYGIQGRWASPDPAGLASVNPADPQTWDRYAYVRNSPLSMVDPTGMVDQVPPPCHTSGCTVTVNGNDGCDLTCRAYFSIMFGFAVGTPMSNMMGYNLSLVNLEMEQVQNLLPSAGVGGGTASPQTPGRTASVNQCAAATANKYSFAALTHTQNVPILGSLLSNYFSSASQLVFGPSRAGGAGSLATNAASLGVGPAAKASGAIPVSSGFQFLFSSTPVTSFAETAVGKLTIGGIGAIADVASGEALVQYFYDAGTYATALVTCSIK